MRLITDLRHLCISIYEYAAWMPCFTVLQGLRGLYAGLLPAVLGSTISWGLYFYLWVPISVDEEIIDSNQHSVYHLCSRCSIENDDFIFDGGMHDFHFDLAFHVLCLHNLEHIWGFSLNFCLFVHLNSVRSLHNLAVSFSVKWSVWLPSYNTKLSAQFVAMIKPSKGMLGTERRGWALVIILLQLLKQGLWWVCRIQ